MVGVKFSDLASTCQREPALIDGLVVPACSIDPMPLDDPFLEALTRDIRHALADICVEPSWDRISPYRFLNRTIYLSQEPVAFATLRRHDDGALYPSAFSVTDPLFTPELKRILVRITNDQAINPELQRRYLIPVFNTQLFIVAFTTSTDTDPCAPKRPAYQPIDITTHPYGALLERAFRPFGAALADLGIEPHILAQNAQLKHPTFTRDTSRPGRIPLNANSPETVARARSTVTEFLDELYARYAGSPIVSPNKRETANLFFFGRAFDRGQERFGVYHYNVRLSLGLNQRAALSRALFRCRQSPASGDSGTWTYIPHNRDGEALPPEAKPRFPIPEIDRRIWQHIENAEFERILDAAGTVQSPVILRLFCDEVLTSGTALVVPDAFVRGELGWVKSIPENIDLSGDALFQLAALHYLHLVAAPASSSPSLLALPLRVAGANWIAAVTTRDNARHPDLAPLIDDIGYQRSLRFYHSTMIPLEHRLRRESKRAYYNAIASILLDDEAHLAGLLADAHPSEVDDIFDDYFSTLNAAMLDLGRVYPYDICEFYPSSGALPLPTWSPPGSNPHGRSLHARYRGRGLWIRTLPNPFFDRVKSLEPYTNTSKLARALLMALHTQAADKGLNFVKFGTPSFTLITNDPPHSQSHAQQEEA